ncbi:MAG: hypothetical protein R2779_07940 [Crocinitomicaceae bacterium]
MKLIVSFLFISLLFSSVAQISSLKKDTQEVPCYEKAKTKRAQGIDLWECGKLAGVIDCNEELEFDHESGLFLKKAKDNVNMMGVGKPYSGSCESCFMNGLLERRITFVDGRENGIDTSYYQDGCIQAIRSHIQGAESGTWYYYYDSTQVLAWEMNYYLGQKNGKQVYFKANGDTTRIEHYKDGVTNWC